MTEDLAAKAARLSIVAATEDTPEAHEAAAAARRASASEMVDEDKYDYAPTNVYGGKTVRHAMDAIGDTYEDTLSQILERFGSTPISMHPVREWVIFRVIPVDECYISKLGRAIMDDALKTEGRSVFSEVIEEFLAHPENVEGIFAEIPDDWECKYTHTTKYGFVMRYLFELWRIS